MSENLFDMGIGQLVVARALPGGLVSAGFFLLDTHCLGVKDAFFPEMMRDDFEHAQERTWDVQTFIAIDPGRARKLIAEAVAYANNPGFPPAREFAAIEPIFGGILPAGDDETFIFGKEGKPLYIAGPSHTPAQAWRIIRTLTNKLGADGFHFIAPLSDADFPGFAADSADFEVDAAGDPMTEFGELQPSY